ncbi:hypothetical protein [Alkaliphilus transvaalensis]|uniref:hypothetical protein n=1 Tax=Alkaliphilus transvaalensis TaxID=114628 RepID=UPI00047BB583|nr:hypothetical protein [Alkaliphilus transvaalensis]
MERDVRNLGDLIIPLNEKHISTEKEEYVKVVRSRISPYYSEGGRAIYKGKGETGVCTIQRKKMPDM